MDQVAQYLLARRFFLTALEFQQELLEEGVNGSGSRILSEYFANPEHFPRDEDVHALWDDGASAHSAAASSAANEQQKASVLEYQLRLAREDIEEMHARLARYEAAAATGEWLPAAQQVPSPLAAPGAVSVASSAHAAGASGSPALVRSPGGHAPAEVDAAILEAPFTEQERGALNALVQAYLLDAGYSVAAASLSADLRGAHSERGGEFGLRPEHTLQVVFRSFLQEIARPDVAELEAQLAAAQSKLKSTEQKLRMQNARLESVTATLERTRQELAMATQGVYGGGSALAHSSLGTPAAAGDAAGASLSAGAGPPNGKPASGNGVDGAAAAGPTDAGGVSDLLSVMATQLPKLMPHVRLNKREEMLPVIEGVVRVHASATQRQLLLQLMFNSQQHPDEAQRAELVKAFTSLCEHTAKARAEDELVPEVKLQLANANVERRVQAVQCIVPVVAACRSHRQLEIAGDLLALCSKDAESDVRKAAAAAVGRACAVLVRLDDSFTALSRWLEVLLFDTSRDVLEAATAVSTNELLHAFAQTRADASWAVVLPWLLRVYERACTAFADTEETWRVVHYAARMLASYWSPLLHAGIEAAGEKVHVATSVASADAAVSSNAALAVASVCEPLFASMERGDRAWACGRALVEYAVPTLVDCVVHLHASTRNTSIWEGVTAMMRSLCTHCGHTFSERVMRLAVDRRLLGLEAEAPATVASPTTDAATTPARADMLAAPAGGRGRSGSRVSIESANSSGAGTPRAAPDSSGAAAAGVASDLALARARLLYVFVLVAIPSVESSVAYEHLKERIVTVALQEDGYTGMHAKLLDDALPILARTEGLAELCVNAVVGLASHPATPVRVLDVRLLEVLAGSVDDKLLGRRLVPLLAELTGDHDRTVRLRCISAAGAVMENTHDAEALERVRVIFESFLDEASSAITSNVLTTFASSLPRCSPSLRDDYVLPRVLAVVVHMGKADRADRAALARVLLEVYRACLEIPSIAPEVLAQCVLPGVSALVGEVKDALDSSYLSLVKSVEKELRDRVPPAMLQKSAERKKGDLFDLLHLRKDKK